MPSPPPDRPTLCAGDGPRGQEERQVRPARKLLIREGEARHLSVQHGHAAPESDAGHQRATALERRPIGAGRMAIRLAAPLSVATRVTGHSIARPRDRLRLTPHRPARDAFCRRFKLFRGTESPAPRMGTSACRSKVVPMRSGIARPKEPAAQGPKQSTRAGMLDKGPMTRHRGPGPVRGLSICSSTDVKWWSPREKLRTLC